MGLKLKSYAWAMSGNMTYALSQWFVVIALNLIGGIEVVGRYALALAFVAPVMMLFNLGLRNVLAVDVKNERKFAEYLKLRSVTSLAGGLVLAGSVWFLYGREISWIVLSLSLYKIMESISDIYNGYQQKERAFQVMATSLFLKSAASMTGTVGVYYLTGNLPLGVLVSAIVMGFVVLYDRYAYRLRSQEDGSEWKAQGIAALTSLALYALPMGVVVFLISLNTNITRYVAHEYLGEAGLGVFSAVAYFVVAGNLVVGSIAQVILPQLADSHHEKGLDPLIKIAGWFKASVVIATALILFSYLIGDFVLEIIYGKMVVAESQHGLLWMSAILALTYFIGMLNSLVNALKAYKILLLSSLLAVLLNLALSTTLIPRYEMVGAYISWWASLVFQSVVLVILIRWRSGYVHHAS